MFEATSHSRKNPPLVKNLRLRKRLVTTLVCALIFAALPVLGSEEAASLVDPQDRAGSRTLADPQGQSIDEMRTVGMAIFAWVIDQVGRQSLDATLGRGLGLDLGDFIAISQVDLQTLLSPTYIDRVPVNDPWGNSYEYWLDTVNLLANPLTAIRSLGADGMAMGTIYPIGPFPIADEDQDLLWTDGSFSRYPDPDWIVDGSFEPGDFSQWSLTVP